MKVVIKEETYCVRTAQIIEGTLFIYRLGTTRIKVFADARFNNRYESPVLCPVKICREIFETRYNTYAITEETEWEAVDKNGDFSIFLSSLYKITDAEGESFLWFVPNRADPEPSQNLEKLQEEKDKKRESLKTFESLVREELVKRNDEHNLKNFSGAFAALVLKLYGQGISLKEAGAIYDEEDKKLVFNAGEVNKKYNRKSRKSQAKQKGEEKKK